MRKRTMSPLTDRDIFEKLGDIEDKVEDNKEAIEELKDDKLMIYANLFCHWDSSFWNATYVFLAIQGALIVAGTQVYHDEILLIYISLIGTFLSLMWLFVVLRKWIYTDQSQNFLIEHLKELYDNIKEKKKWPAIFSSAKIMIYVLPSSFLFGWMMVFIFVVGLLENIAHIFS